MTQTGLLSHFKTYGCRLQKEKIVHMLERESTNVENFAQIIYKPYKRGFPTKVVENHVESV